MLRRVISLDYAVSFVARIRAVEFVRDLEWESLHICKERDNTRKTHGIAKFSVHRINGFERLNSVQKHRGFGRRDFLSPLDVL